VFEIVLSVLRQNAATKQKQNKKRKKTKFLSLFFSKYYITQLLLKKHANKKSYTYIQSFR